MNATPWSVWAVSFLPHTKMQFVTADGPSDPPCQVQCLQQWPVPGVCEALPPGSTWPNAWCWTERTNFSSGPAALTWCTIDTHKDKCSTQILGCCRSPSHLQSQDRPSGDVWAQHMQEAREFQTQKASVRTETWPAGRACSRGQPSPRASPSTTAWSSFLVGELDMEDKPNIDLDCARHHLSALYFSIIEISGYCQSLPANKPPPLWTYLILKRKGQGRMYTSGRAQERERRWTMCSVLPKPPEPSTRPRCGRLGAHVCLGYSLWKPC